VRGLGRPALLDSYDAERHPVGQAVVDTTDRATKGMLRMMTLRSPLAQSLRNQAVRFLFNSGMFQDFVFRGLGGVSVGYADSPIVGEHHSSLWQSRVAGDKGEHPGPGDWVAFERGPGPGARVPDVALEGDRASSLFDLMRGTHHLLLLFDGAAATTEGYARLGAIATRVEQRYGDAIRTYAVVPAPRRPEGLGDDINLLPDEDMTLHQHFGCATEGLCLLRPDGYVGFRSQPADEDAILRYLERIFAG
jgi:hypothetical protein